MMTINDYIINDDLNNPTNVENKPSANSTLEVGSIIEMDVNGVTVLAACSDISKGDNPIYTFKTFGCKGGEQSIGKVKKMYKLKLKQINNILMLKIVDNIQNFILKQLKVS